MINFVLYLYETYNRCFHCNNCKKKNTTYFIIRKYLTKYHITILNFQ